MATFKVGYTVLGYQPENVGKHADVSTLMHRSSSGRRSRNGNASFLWPYITFTVTRVRGIRGKSISGCPVGPAFLSSQGSHPASRELKSCVSVEAFPIRGHVKVDGFLEQQFTRVSSHVNHCGLIPLDGMLVLPCMFSYCDVSSAPSCRLLGAPSTSCPIFFWSHRCRSCHNCRGFGTQPWTALHW